MQRKAIQQPEAGSKPPNLHDKLIQRAWQNCREALALCREDATARQQALNFAVRARRVAPAHMQRWIEILQGGFADHVTLLLETASFFDLPPAEAAWWDQLIQSAPFAPVLGAPRRGRIKSVRKSLDFKRGESMTLEQFDHICRAAAAIANVSQVYVFGANAIIPWLATAGHPIPLPAFRPSRELDISVGNDALDTLIDGAIGELSAFDQTFLVYAHGVSLSSFQAPINWQSRIAKRTEPVEGVEIAIPHPHDLLLSKLVAGRPKDFDFATRVASLFPISDDELKRLVEEFRQAHPQAVAQLQANIETWKEHHSKASASRS